MFITKEPLKNALADTRRGWIKDYQEERRVEVKADADNFSIDIQNHITYNVGYNRKVKWDTNTQ